MHVTGYAHDINYAPGKLSVLIFGDPVTVWLYCIRIMAEPEGSHHYYLGYNLPLDLIIKFMFLHVFAFVCFCVK
jgi:hypothetical protein